MNDYNDLPLLRSWLRQCADLQPPHGSKDWNDVLERMAVVTTELATNALQHGQCAAVVRLSRSTSAFVIDVADELPSAPPQIATERPLTEGGRGIQITQALANDTGWYVSGPRKHVWATFDIPRRPRRFQAPRISLFDTGILTRLLRRLGS